MIRMIVTFGVGLGLLVGVGAWFDPEGAREAIRRDLSGIAGRAASEAEEVARDVITRVVENRSVRAPEAMADQPDAGPRTGKKRPPVIAASSQPAAVAPSEEGGAVEEVNVAARGDFVEAPLARPEAIARVSSPTRGPYGRGPEPHEGGGPAQEAPEHGVLIRRMLALYDRVSERR
jgi:hypothetical protein